MIKSKKILALIPARGGSKGIKKKNIIDCAGKPLIWWTIQAALQSRYIDRVIVSTDSKEIAQVAKESGADVPFLRPKEFAQDNSSHAQVIDHCVDWLKKNEGMEFDYLMHLQPTSPLRTAEHIDSAIEYYFNNRKTKNDTLVSVVLAPKRTAWLMSEDKRGYISYILKLSNNNLHRQHLPNSYFPNGMIFFGPIKAIQKNGFYSKCTLPFVMEESVSADIDAKEDLQKVETILKARKISE